MQSTSQSYDQSEPTLSSCCPKCTSNSLSRIMVVSYPLPWPTLIQPWSVYCQHCPSRHNSSALVYSSFQNLKSYGIHFFTMNRRHGSGVLVRIIWSQTNYVRILPWPWQIPDAAHLDLWATTILGPSFCFSPVELSLLLDHSTRKHFEQNIVRCNVVIGISDNAACSCTRRTHQTGI